MTMRGDPGNEADQAGAGDGRALAVFLRRLQWGLVALAAGWLLWLLSPVLTPFVFAAMLGWLGDPLVDRMQARGVPRNGAVIIVFAAMGLLYLFRDRGRRAS